MIFFCIRTKIREILGALTAHQAVGESQKTDLHDKLHDKLHDIDEDDWRLLALLHADGTMTAEKLSGRLGISLRNVRLRIAKLREFGVLSREGSNKKGRWLILF